MIIWTFSINGRILISHLWNNQLLSWISVQLLRSPLALLMLLTILILAILGFLTGSMAIFLPLNIIFNYFSFSVRTVIRFAPKENPLYLLTKLIVASVYLPMEYLMLILENAWLVVPLEHFWISQLILVLLLFVNIMGKFIIRLQINVIAQTKNLT